jgi:3-phenylpropionate/cinnamic acid dioxygenase small subunit
MVTNIRVSQRAGDSAAMKVVSNLALYCYRGDSPQPVIITAERQDVLRRADVGWQLGQRRVLLDATVLGLQSLSVFL